MAINYGKGLRGALGRMKAVESQYVGLPYKEMLQGNLMRQASYDKGEETLDSLSQLYNASVLPGDDDLLQAKEDVFNTETAAKMESVGNDLGKLTGFLSGKLRNISSDPTYLQALQNKKDVATYFQSVDKAKIDPEMKAYLKNKSMSGYGGADKGGFSGMPFMEITSADFSKDLQRVAKQLYDTAPVKEDEHYVLIGPDGIQITGEDINNYREGEGFEPGYELKRQQVKYKVRTPKEIKDYLDSYIDQNYRTYLGAVADQRGADYDTAKGMLTTPTANNYSRFEKDLGNIYKVADTSGGDAPTGESSYKTSAIPMVTPEATLIASLVEGTDKTPEAIAQRLEDKAAEDPNFNKVFAQSVINVARKKSGLAETDQLDVDEELNKVGKDNPLFKYFTDENGEINKNIFRNPKDFSARISRLGDDADSTRELFTNLKDTYFDVTSRKENAQAEFEKIIAEGTITPEVSDVIAFADKDPAKINNITKEILENPALAHQAFVREDTDKTNVWTEVDIDEMEEVDKASLFSFEKHPRKEEGGTFRTLEIKGKEVTYKIKMPEDQFQSIFASGGEMDLYELSGAKKEEKNAYDGSINLISSEAGLETAVPEFEEPLKDQISRLIEMAKTLNVGINDVEVETLLTKTGIGYELKVDVIIDNPNTPAQHKISKDIKGIKNRGEVKSTLDNFLFGEKFLDEIYEKMRLIK